MAASERVGQCGVAPFSAHARTDAEGGVAQSGCALELSALVDRCGARCWPVHWEEILSAGNTHPPMTLRVNARRTNVAHYLEYLRARHISALAADEYAIQLTRPRPVEQLPGFKE